MITASSNEEMTMDATPALTMAGIIFALVALVHLLRLVYRFDVVIAGKSIPLWANVVGLLISGSMSIWMFTLIDGARAWLHF